MNKTKTQTIKCSWCGEIAIKKHTDEGKGGSFYCFKCNMNVKERG